MSQELTKHHAVFMDSIGPAVKVNGTVNSDGFGGEYYTTVDYWGNASSWSDCFTLASPTSGDGFLSDWMVQNRASIFRIAAGL
jgi:hypothetical protein